MSRPTVLSLLPFGEYSLPKYCDDMADVLPPINAVFTVTLNLIKMYFLPKNYCRNYEKCLNCYKHVDAIEKVSFFWNLKTSIWIWLSLEMSKILIS